MSWWHHRRNARRQLGRRRIPKPGAAPLVRLGCELCNGRGLCWCWDGEGMGYRIRRARPSELKAVIAMDRACFPYDSREDFRRTRSVWWVVVHDGELVGYAGGYPWNYGNENAFIMCRCGVVPEHRGQGLQRRLLAARLAYAKRDGRKLAWTYTSTTNTASANNLIRAGFTLWQPARWGGVNNPAEPRGGYAWLYWKRKL